MRKLLIIIVFFSSANFTSAKVLINEIMPNPSGRDRGNEWVELFNDSFESVDLTGWKIQKKKLNGAILPKSYKIIKVALRNKDNQVQLFSPSGIVDKIYYNEAREGLALTREKYWLPPTPNAPNPQVKTKIISAKELIAKLLTKPDPYTIYIVPTQIPAQQKRSLNLIPLFFIAILLIALHYKSSGQYPHG